MIHLFVVFLKFNVTKTKQSNLYIVQYDVKLMKSYRK